MWIYSQLVAFNVWLRQCMSWMSKDDLLLIASASYICDVHCASRERLVGHDGRLVGHSGRPWRSTHMGHIAVLSTNATNNENQKTHTFEKKNMLKEVFFFFSSIADLSDLQKYTYLAHVKCLITIVKKEIVATLSRLRLDKTSEFDDITNKILKTCIQSLTKLLISLF